MYAVYTDTLRCLPDRRIQRIEVRVDPSDSVEDQLWPEHTRRGEKSLQHRKIHGVYASADLAVVHALALVNGRNTPGRSLSASGYTVADNPGHWYCCIHVAAKEKS